MTKFMQPWELQWTKCNAGTVIDPRRFPKMSSPIHDRVRLLGRSASNFWWTWQSNMAMPSQFLNFLRARCAGQKMPPGSVAPGASPTLEALPPDGHLHGHPHVVAIPREAALAPVPALAIGAFAPVPLPPAVAHCFHLLHLVTCWAQEHHIFGRRPLVLLVRNPANPPFKPLHRYILKTSEGMKLAYGGDIWHLMILSSHFGVNVSPSTNSNLLGLWVPSQ